MSDRISDHLPVHHRDSLSFPSKDLEKLKLDSRNNALKNELEDETESIKSQLDNNYTVLKKANLFAKNRIIQHSKAALFERNQDEPDGEEAKLRRRRKGDAFLVNKTSSVTDNLFQITKLMSEQVNQSDSSLQALINSSSTVIETQEEIKLMGSHLVNSKTLLTKYGRRECTDKILIFLALGFFLACVLFCVSKRLW